VPPFIYGTAWKEADTTRLTQLAMSAGFRAIDTANQAKHYQEALVGEALASQGIARGSYFLQSKFTSIDSQDSRLPYDPNASYATQVLQSFASSLEHLHTDYLDSYLMHGPSSSQGLATEDWEVWTAMEEVYSSGQTKLIGVSNINSGQLELLLEKSNTAPMVVQNRCYASRGWDRTVREICKNNGIIYQGFSLLTANKTIVQDPRVGDLAAQYGVNSEQIIFRFASQIGMTPLTGTTSEQHMREDLEIFNFELNTDELAMVESIAG